MFLAAFLTTAKIRKQPKGPSTDERIKKMWYIYYIYTMEYYSAIKKNEILPFAATWTDLEGIRLREVSQTKTVLYVITYMWILKNETNEYNKTEAESQIQRTK